MEIEIRGQIEDSRGKKIDVPVTLTVEPELKDDDGCGVYTILFISILLNVMLIMFLGGC